MGLLRHTSSTSVLKGVVRRPSPSYTVWSSYSYPSNFIGRKIDDRPGLCVL
jgi:hypothetical protein